MDRDRFVAQGRPRWSELEALLDRLRLDAGGWSALSRLYRAAAADLSRARSLDLPGDVTAYLDDLAGRAHNRLYGGRRGGSQDLLRLVLREVPREVRAHAAYFWVASALFYGPLAIGAVGAWWSPDAAALVLDPASLDQVREAYAEAPDRGALGADAGMAGFYVYNNVGIAFRCFATGAFGGLGTLWFLVTNGAFIGTIAGHLVREGVGHNLLAFVAGHSAWELTGIVLAGAAGLRMGHAMIETGGRSVAASLRGVGPALFRLVVGASTLLLVAAVIEGFWSAGPVPLPGKLAFGVVQVAIVTGWLLGGGREQG